MVTDCKQIDEKHLRFVRYVVKSSDMVLSEMTSDEFGAGIP